MAPQAFQQLGDAAEQAWAAVQAEIKEKMAEFQGQEGVLNGLRAFAAAVDWTEPWIAYLMTFHVLLLTTVLVQRRSQTVTAAVFFLCVGLVWNAERLNSLASRHWKRFARQNYFDEHGVFTGALLGAPLLAIMFVILIINLLQMASLLVRMKRKELQIKARQRRQAEATDTVGGDGAAKDGNGSSGQAAAGSGAD